MAHLDTVQSAAAQHAVVVHLEDPEHASLLALLMRRMLDARLAEPHSARRIARMRGDVRLVAGGMTLGLRFEQGRVAVVRTVEHARAWVEGDVATLLRLVAGGLPLRRVLAGRLKVGGDPRLLFRLWAVLRAREGRT